MLAKHGIQDLTVELENHLVKLMDILLQDNVREQDMALSAARAVRVSTFLLMSLCRPIH